MSFATTCRTIQTQDPSELLAQRPPSSSHNHYVAMLRQNLRRYEEQYGIPSEKLEATLKSGALVEDFDVCDWLIQNILLLRAEARRPSDHITGRGKRPSPTAVVAGLG